MRSFDPATLKEVNRATGRGRLMRPLTVKSNQESGEVHGSATGTDTFELRPRRRRDRQPFRELLHRNGDAAAGLAASTLSHHRQQGIGEERDVPPSLRRPAEGPSAPPEKLQGNLLRARLRPPVR